MNELAENLILLKITLFAHLKKLMDGLQDTFRRRTFQTIALDENNRFRALSSFIRPQGLPSGIPAFGESVISTILFHLSKLPNAEDKHVRKTTQRANRSSFLSSRQTIGPSVHSGMHPVASPATILFRGYAGSLEKAIFLVNLFLGANTDAYLAVGSVRGQYFPWVVTFGFISGFQEKSSMLDPKGFSSSSGSSVTSALPEGRKFAQMDRLGTTVEGNLKRSVLHWNPITCESPKD